MAIVIDDFFNREKSYINDEINELDSKLETKDTLLKGDLLFLKMRKEQDSKLLDTLSCYPKFAYRFNLLEASLPKYRMLVKSELLSKRARLLANITSYKKHYSMCLTKLDECEDLFSRSDIETEIEIIKEKLVIAQNELESINEETASLSSKTREQFMNDLIRKCDETNFNDLRLLASYDDISSRDKVIYLMVGEKSKYQTLTTVLTNVRQLSSDRKNIRVSFNYNESDLTPAERNDLIDNFGIYHSGMKLRMDKLMAIKAALFNKYDTVLSAYQDFSDTKLLSALSDRNIDSIDLVYNYYNSLCKLVEMTEYISKYESFIHLKNKPLKNKHDKEELNMMHEWLRECAHKIIEEATNRIMNSFRKFEEETGNKFAIYPASLNNIINNISSIVALKNDYVKGLYNLAESVNTNIGEINVQIKDIDFKIKDNILGLSEETGIKLDGDEDFNMSSLKALEIHDRVYIAKKINDFDDEIMDSIYEPTNYKTRVLTK